MLGSFIIKVCQMFHFLSCYAYFSLHYLLFYFFYKRKWIIIIEGLGPLSKISSLLHQFLTCWPNNIVWVSNNSIDIRCNIAMLYLKKLLWLFNKMLLEIYNEIKLVFKCHVFLPILCWCILDRAGDYVWSLVNAYAHEDERQSSLLKKISHEC